MQNNYSFMLYTHIRTHVLYKYNRWVWKHDAYFWLKHLSNVCKKKKFNILQNTRQCSTQQVTHFIFSLPKIQSRYSLQIKTRHLS